MDYDVMDPNNVPVLHGNTERQGDFAFTAQLAGEYSFCFSNSMSSFAAKVLDFDITVEHESRFSSGKYMSDLHAAVGSIAGKESQTAAEKATLALESQIGFVAAEISSYERRQRDIRTREHRNIAAVKGLHDRIFWLAVFVSVVMLAMSILQVYVIQTFFSKGMRSRV